MQNLRNVGINSGPILSSLWTKVYIILRRCKKSLVISNALARLCMSCFVPKTYITLNLPLSCEVVEKVVWGRPIFKWRGYPRFRTYVFKSHSLLTMWPILVEFRSASSEGGDEKREKKIEGLCRAA